MSRRKGPVETAEYGAMVRRMLKAYARRVGEADEIELAEFGRLRDEIDAALGEAVRLQRTQYGRSWADIGGALGITRQAAQQRFGGAG